MFSRYWCSEISCVPPTFMAPLCLVFLPQKELEYFIYQILFLRKTEGFVYYAAAAAVYVYSFGLNNVRQVGSKKCYVYDTMSRFPCFFPIWTSSAKL